MASTTTIVPSLPSKKRKPSYDSFDETGRIRKDSEPDASTSTNNSTSTGKGHHIAENRLPSKKRKGSHDSFSLERRRRESHDLSVSFDDTLSLSRKGSIDSSFMLEPLPRKLSHDTTFKIDELMVSSDGASASGVERILPSACTGALGGTSSSALDHLDALAKEPHGGPLPPLPPFNHASDSMSSARRKYSDVDDNSSFASSGQRLLFEAMIGGGDDSSKDLSHGREHSEPWGGSRARLGSFSRERSDSLTRDRAESWGGLRIGGEGRDRLDSWGGIRGRDRLESWGAMSDLSVPLGSLESTGAHLYTIPTTASHQNADHLPLDESHNMHDAEDSKPCAIPSKISVDRARLNSVASSSEFSVSNLPLVVDGVDLSGDIQVYVAAAMAAVGDQIADLASAVEHVAHSSDSVAIDTISKLVKPPLDDASSEASPLIGAMLDASRGRYRLRSLSTTSGVISASGMISLDLEAVEAAMNVADLVTASGVLDLGGIPLVGSNLDVASHGSSSDSGNKKSSNARRKRKLPVHRSSDSVHSAALPVKKATRSRKQDKRRIRKRAKQSNGPVPSQLEPGDASTPTPPAEIVSTAHSGRPPRAPPKKRSKRNAQEISDSPSTLAQTPKHSNSRLCYVPQDAPCVPDTTLSILADETPSSSSAMRTPRGQASQKWDSMYDCLMEFVAERRDEETKGMTDQEKSAWVWDGNVPTNFKTKSGKALGRWINNQRSAKSKGTLKEEREQRLVDSGLRWSVLAAGSWNHMLEELKIYIREQTKNGGKWDGNVPTTYQIRTRENSPFAGEDKNLGRWVNRQRSLFQSGKLRDDRRKELEDIGLKWSMLATLSWDAMFETMTEYVKQQKKDHGTWDGNVPANFKTSDNPPRALGRWVNRQRSSYMKTKLKQEYVDKLNEIGLKWSVHNRQGDPGEDNYDDDDDDDGDDVVIVECTGKEKDKTSSNDDISKKNDRSDIVSEVGHIPAENKAASSAQES